MIRRQRKIGFTLIEMLISTTLIVLIVSVTYGTWIATARTTARLKSSLADAPIHRAIQNQISRQLRGCYVDDSYDNLKNASTSDQNKKQVIFQAKNNATDGVILQYLTTTGFFYGKDETLNLLAVRYRYNSQQQRLLYQQQPYHSGKKPNWTDPWHTVSGKIASVSILCFDGKKWHDQWNYHKEEQLPHAVKITYTTIDSNDHQKTYTVLAALNVQHDEK